MASSFGLTTNCWMIAGYKPPMRIADRTSSPKTDRGEHRAAPGRAREEQQGAQHGDHREHGLGRQHRVDVRVGGAGGDRAALGEVDAVPVDPVRHGLEQHEHAEQHEQVGLRRHRHPGVAALHAQPAVQIVHQRGQHQRDQHRREQVTQHHPDERVGEDEEGQIPVELQICFMKRDLVGEQQPGAPRACGGDPGDHAHQADHQAQQEPPVRVDGQPVGIPALAWRGHRAVDGPQPVGEHRVRPGDHGHEQPGHEEHRPAGAVGGAEHRRVVDGPVPQEVRPDPGHDRDQDQEGDQAHDDREDQPGPAEVGKRRAASRLPGRTGPEGHRTPPHTLLSATSVVNATLLAPRYPAGLTSTPFLSRISTAQGCWAVRRQCTPIRAARRHRRRRCDHVTVR